MNLLSFWGEPSTMSLAMTDTDRFASVFRRWIYASILWLATLGSLGASPAVAAAASEATKDEAPRVLDAALQRPQGGIEHLSDHRGQRLLLDLWATWCLPCREQSEIVHGLAEDLKKYEVKVLAINIGQGPRIVLDFLSRTPSPHPILLDRGQQIPKQVSVHGLPALVLLHEDGTVAGVRTGLVEREDLAAWLGEAFGDSKNAP